MIARFHSLSVNDPQAIADLRRDFAPIHAARLDTAGCPTISVHRADMVENATHEAGALCPCRSCDDARRLQIRLAAARIMARRELAAMTRRAANHNADRVNMTESGEYPVPAANDNSCVTVSTGARRAS